MSFLFLFTGHNARRECGEPSLAAHCEYSLLFSLSVTHCWIPASTFIVDTDTQEHRECEVWTLRGSASNLNTGDKVVGILCASRAAPEDFNKP